MNMEIPETLMTRNIDTDKDGYYYIKMPNGKILRFSPEGYFINSVQDYIG